MHDFLKWKSITEIQESLEQVWLQWILWKNWPGRTNIMIYLLFIQSMHSSNCTQWACPPTEGLYFALVTLRQLPKVIFSLILGILKSKGSSLRNHVLIVDIHEPKLLKTGFQQGHTPCTVCYQLWQHSENNTWICEIMTTKHYWV